MIIIKIGQGLFGKSNGALPLTGNQIFRQVLIRKTFGAKWRLG